MTTTVTDRQGVEAALERLLDAWARHDAAAYAAEFTDDATYITFVGTHYRGRDEIEGTHRVLFDTHLRGTQLADEVLSVRFLTPETAVVTSRGDTYKGARPKKLTKVQTYTLVHTDAGWRIAAFQNTQRKPFMEAITFRSDTRLVPAN